MYSMVLLASLTTAGDAPAFGKHKSGGCTGAVATTGCTGGYAVAAPVACYGGSAAGCHGAAAAPRAGFLGLCHKKKAATGCTGGVASTGCTGYVAPAPACCGSVAAPVVVAAPAPVVVAPAPVVMQAPVVSYGCTGGGYPAASCYGSAAAKAPRAGFLGCCKKKAASGCTGGCYGY